MNGSIRVTERSGGPGRSHDSPDERSESGFFTHVFAVRGTRSERSERGYPSGKKMVCTDHSTISIYQYLRVSWLVVYSWWRQASLQGPDFETSVAACGDFAPAIFECDVRITDRGSVRGDQ